MVTRNCLIFVSGLLVGALIVYLISFGSGIEVPILSGLSVTDLSAPADHIDERDILVFDDYVLIKVSGATISRYAPTGSMKPVFDNGANGIRIVPETEDDINVGDVISYRNGNHLIVHRVIEKGIDPRGIYFITQGDNSNFNDGKVRFEDVEYITVAVIW